MVYHTETSNQRFSALRLHARLVRLPRFTKKNLQHTTYKTFAEAELNPYGRFGSLLIDLAAGDTSVGSTTTETSPERSAFLISTAVDSCVLAKLSLDALGRAAVFVSSAKLGSRHPGFSRFSINVVSFSPNLVLSGPSFSANVVRK
jgi:hypothetical protein